MTQSNESTFIGIDLGGSTLKGALVDNSGEILQEIRQETEHESSAALVKQLADAVRSLRGDRRAQHASAIGIGIPGLVNRKTSRVELMPNLPSLADIDITAELAREAGLPVIIDGRIYRGAGGFAGEFGHMTIDPEGIECVCGNIGCLETICSGPNIVRRTRERLYRDRTSSLSRLALPRDREFTAEDIA